MNKPRQVLRAEGSFWPPAASFAGDEGIHGQAPGPQAAYAELGIRNFSERWIWWNGIRRARIAIASIQCAESLGLAAARFMNLKKAGWVGLLGGAS